jgi:hypothetical protein
MLSIVTGTQERRCSIGGTNVVEARVPNDVFDGVRVGMVAGLPVEEQTLLR